MKIAIAPHRLMKASPRGSSVRMGRKRPHPDDRPLAVVAEPEEKPVAERGAQRASDQDGPEGNAARLHQRADPDQHRPGRDEERKKGQRFSKGEGKDDRRRPCLVLPDKLDDLPGQFFKGHVTADQDTA